MKKQHLAALRNFFDALVLRHVIPLNPLFRAAKRKVRALGENRMQRVYIWHMIKRRCLEAGLPADKLTGHSIQGKPNLHDTRGNKPLTNRLLRLTRHAVMGNRAIYD